MGGSAALYVQGNSRKPGDIDLFVPDEDHDRLDQLFGIESVYNESVTDQARLSYITEDHTISLHSKFKVRSDGPVRQMRIRTALDKAEYYQPAITPAGILRVLKAEDIMVIKAMLRRGTQHGDKRDLEDIAALRKYPVDYDYIKMRLDQNNAGSEPRRVLLEDSMAQL